MSGYDAYAEAKRTAQERADATGFDHGIERNAFGWIVHMLPRAENRRGFELRCEIVHCSDLAKCQPGHGPTQQPSGPRWPVQQ